MLETVVIWPGLPLLWTNCWEKLAIGSSFVLCWWDSAAASRPLLATLPTASERDLKWPWFSHHLCPAVLNCRSAVFLYQPFCADNKAAVMMFLYFDPESSLQSLPGCFLKTFVYNGQPVPFCYGAARPIVCNSPQYHAACMWSKDQRTSYTSLYCYLRLPASSSGCCKLWHQILPWWTIPAVAYAGGMGGLLHHSLLPPRIRRLALCSTGTGLTAKSCHRYSILSWWEETAICPVRTGAAKYLLHRLFCSKLLTFSLSIPLRSSSPQSNAKWILRRAFLYHVLPDNHLWIFFIVYLNLGKILGFVNIRLLKGAGCFII